MDSEVLSVSWKAAEGRINKTFAEASKI